MVGNLIRLADAITEVVKRLDALHAEMLEARTRTDLERLETEAEAFLVRSRLRLVAAARRGEPENGPGSSNR
jgi:hypothetical protein